MKNFKKKIVAIMTSVFCFAALIPAVPAMADAQKVVTLGADLSEDQQIMMLEYFGVYGEPVETLFINNTEEREHLEAYVPIEQIGTRTVSCAMVNPTTSGGIQVKTANLTWVTGNMIASTLSTSGVVNCEVLAAAPFPVSGTGALTGIMMAYETASGETLDEAKKDAATQELVATATIAGDVGQDTAVQIVNETKVEVIENGASTEEIQGIIDNATQDLEVSLTPEDRDLLTNLLDTVSGLDYDDDEVDAMKSVTDNDDEDSSDSEEISDEDEDSGSIPADENAGSDSILDNTDDAALGDDVVFTDTTEPITDEDNNDEGTQDAGESDEDDGHFDIVDSDTYNEPEGTAEGTTEGTTEETTEGTTEETMEGTTEETADEGTAADETDTGVTESGGFPVSELVLIPNKDKDETDLEAVPEETPEKAAPGLNCLTVQSSMTDLAAGSGEVSIYYTENNELIETIRMDDPEHVVWAEITDEETLKDLDWDEGIEFRIILSDPLEADKSYYAVLSEDAFNAAGGTLTLTESGVDDWVFETAAYGISVEETVEGIKTGEPASVNLYMDPEADYAVVEYILPDGTEVYTDEEYTEDCSFDLTFDQAGKITVKASYYAGAAEEEPEASDESVGLTEFEDSKGFAGPISEAEYTVIVNPQGMQE